MNNNSMQEPERQRFYWLFFLLVLGVAIILRVPYLSAERLWPDEALYAWNAKRIFLHPQLIFSREIIDYHPPLFAAILSPAHWLFPPLTACRMTVFLINILGIAAVYVLGRRVQGPFLGCLAAMLLAFHERFFGLSGQVLIDGVLVVFVVLFFISFREMPSRKMTPQDLWISLAVMAMILLKWSGGLALMFVLFYYLLCFDQLTVRERIVKAGAVLVPSAVLVVLLLGLNHAVLGSWIPKVFGHSYDRFHQPFFYYWGQLDYLIDWPYVPFLLIGLFMALKHPDHRYRVHGVWIYFIFIVISLMVNKDNRFMLVLLPSVIFLTAVGLEKVVCWVSGERSDHFLRPVILLAVFTGLLFVQYPRSLPYLNASASTYSGFREAGDYVSRFVQHSPRAAVLAGSPRGIRYFSGVNFPEFGGSLSPLPESEAGLREWIARSPQGLLLIVDEWEWTQPAWLYPMTNEKLAVLRAMGFRLVSVINKPMGQTDFTIRRHDVIWIFVHGR